MADPVDPNGTVGARCVCEGHYGTIRFIGDVPPTKGVWFGVEWDDPTRGKHSGEHEGVFYFKTRVPGSGSFVRPKKVDSGWSFMEAVRNQYGVTEVEEDLVVGGQSVELVGMDLVARKQREYDKLKEVSLLRMRVSSSGPQGEIAAAAPSTFNLIVVNGPQGEIAAAAPNIEMLNLSENLLLSCWATLAEITSQLKSLDQLDLSGCVGLAHVAEDVSSCSSAFQSLTTLSLNRIEISWENVSLILRAMPRLEALHVCGNNIQTLRFEGDGDRSYLPEGLKLLNLGKNKLCDWADIMMLEPHLKQLKSFFLSDNDLPAIFLENVDSFPNLSSLSLSRNLISQWSSVTSLASLSGLLELKLKENPLLKDESGFSVRQLLIARLHQIQSLNNSRISPRERVLAERYYIKRYGHQWLECKSDESAKQSFLLEHPRFPQLVEIHGLPDEVLTGQKPVTTALKHGLISVTVKCPDHPELKPLTKKLPGSMLVQKLKGLLHRMYKVDTFDQRLSYQDSRGDCEVELDDDLKELSFFSIENGNTILLRWN